MTTTTEPFVPLSPASRNAGSVDRRVNVISQPDGALAFKPLAFENLSGAKNAAPHSGKACEPRVSIQREGDQVTGIQIHCGCGQVIDLACIY